MWPLCKCDDEVQRVATWAVAQVCTLSAEISGAGGAHCQAIVFPSYRQGSLLGGHIVGE